MNRRPGLTAAIAWILVVIFTASGSAWAGSLVLCVGSDGHADIEVALGDCCLTENADRGGARSENALVDPCGGCADIELDATPRTEERHRLNPPCPIATDAAADLSRPLEPICKAEHGTLIGRSDLQALATVVLLT